MTDQSGRPTTPSANAGWPSNSIPFGEQAVNPQRYEVKYPCQPDTEEPQAFLMRRNLEISNWLATKDNVKIAVNLEKDYRSKVFSTLFPNPVKGTNRYKLPDGYAVKLTYTLTYKLGDKDKVDEATGEKVSVEKQILALEEAVCALGEAHKQVFERVVRWKPECSGSEYEKLNELDQVQLEVRNMIDEHLTITPSETPTLTWEEPKAPKK